jgi:amino acid adenylation domain-containing protein
MSSMASTLQQLSPEQKRRLLARLMSEDESTQSFPLSFSQQRLWFLHKLSPDSPFYNVEAAIPITASLDAEALQRAINAVVERHEILRTVFRDDDGQPVQVVLPALQIELQTIDLRSRSETNRQQEVLRVRTEQAQRPYDLSVGPLLRTTLIFLNARESLFLVGMHHIVSDGWSMGIFGRELAAFYAEFAGGPKATLPPLSIQYKDYAVWQRKWLSGDNLARQLQYWRKQLTGISLLDLPTDRVRPPVQTYRGAVYNFSLGKTLSLRLSELSHNQGVTLFMVLLTAFKILLYRYSGQTDLAVGTYIANRNRAEIEPLIGFFLNTLILRTDLSGDPTFLESLKAVREVSLGAYANQDLPFEMLVEELRPPRDLSRNPLVQVTFQLSNAPTQSSSGNMESLMDSKRGASIFDLACMLFESNGELAGQFEYSTDLFDESTLERLTTHFKTLLSEVVENPEQRISEIPILDRGEKQKLLFEWNQTKVTRASAPGLLEQFESIAKRKSQSVAFYHNNQTLTYDELAQRAARVAHRLRSVGARPGTIVACCVQRSLDLPPAMLGILQASSIYLPLDPAYPAARLSYMLEDSGAKILLTAGPLPEGLRLPPSVEVVDLLQAEDSVSPLIDCDSQPSSDKDAAYIIYTSGSTGKPKGIIAGYKQILSRFEWMWRTYPFAEDEICCQKTALSFIDSIWELMGPLLRGVPSVIFGNDVVRDPDLMLKELARYRVTRIWLVPSMLEALLDTYPDLRERLPHLNFWVSTGEPLSARLVQKFRRTLPGARIYNLYGTSEAWDSTWYDATDLPASATSVPIGRPIDNVQAYVLDHHLEPVPIGVVGELVVTGDGLSNGYLNNGHRAGERFVDLPFRDDAAVGYRTGDSARFLADGTIECLGRLDQQLKIHGFRVEPAEIELELAKIPGISAAAVIGDGDDSNGISLTAYLVLNNGEAPATSELRSVLRERLPEFMIPTAFLHVEQMPLTPSGKLDRKALKTKGVAVATSENEYVAPRDEDETRIAGMWAELLHRDRIGAFDNFFDLGGHSLLATQVISRIQKSFGLHLPLETFFRSPTIAAIAAELKKNTSRSEQRLIPRLKRSDFAVE